MIDAPGQFIDEMAQAGFEIETPWDLVLARYPYGPAIPILLDWLRRADAEVPADQRRRFLEGVVRSLAVKEARKTEAGLALIKEFKERAYVNSSYRWAVANTLSIIADDRVFADLVELSQDSRFGQEREMLAVALSRTKNPQAVDVLIRLLGDPEVAGHAVTALGNLKAKRARDSIVPFVESPSAWIRKEATRALKKIDAAQA